MDRYTRNYDGSRHRGVRMGTLWCDRNDIDGDVTLSVAFCTENRLARLDLLNDFIGLLNREYEVTVKEFNADLADIVAARLSGEKDV